MKYFVFAKKRVSTKKPVQKKTKGAAHPPLLPIEKILTSWSGKLAAVSVVQKQLAEIKKPTKQLQEFQLWVTEYESQLLDEWNRFNN